ncbi:MAG: tRNA-dihydrouridine synthase, partial [Cruoricaptor ignavus]|nr:tRNA-dihydrouridine synthase [Cruoricaptor ignavus]
HISRIKNNPNIEIPIFGNGDIDNPEKAQLYKEKYDCDGIMIGRGAIGYPWIFNEIKHFFRTGELLPEPTIAQRLQAVKQHAEWSVEWKGERAGLVEMRQHYSNYFRGVPHFKEHRKKFLAVLSLEEMEEVISEVQCSSVTM